MKVRMLVDLSGPSFHFEAGDIYECDDAEATRLFSARYAVPLETTEDKRVTEAAVAAPVEKAVKRPVTRRKKKG